MKYVKLHLIKANDAKVWSSPQFWMSSSVSSWDPKEDGPKRDGQKMLTGGWLQGGWAKKGCMSWSTCIQVAKASMMDMIPIIVRTFRNPSTSPTLKGAMLRFAWAFGNFTSIDSADERYPVRNSRKCSENCAFVG